MAEILVIEEAVTFAAGDGTHPVTRELCHAADDIARRTGHEWASLEVALPEALLRDPAAFGEAIAEASRDSWLVMMGSTSLGRDVMARAAGLLQVPLAQDCTAYSVTDGSPTFTRPLYGGKVLVDVQLKSRPMLATFRPRALPAFDGVARVLKHVACRSPTSPVVQVDVCAARVGRTLGVTEADVVVSGGRGMVGPDNWHILEELVSVLGPRATLACSRPVSDEGWRPRAEHVGQTGQAIAPDVYIACGISGAIQHVAGITGSKCIIAINRDADAPIFKVADYGIVGDLFEVVPALTQAIRAFGDS